jgi:nitrous oxidase accessory protein NosD
VADFSGSYDIFQMEIQDESIQKSIEAIASGGTIYLKEGIYKGPVTIDKSVALLGADSGETSVDGSRQGSVFTIGKTNPNIDVELSTLSILAPARAFSF